MFRITTIVMLVLFSGPALADEQVDWLNDAKTGQFLVHSSDGGWESALLLNTEAEIEVNGPVAEVTITQHFSNRNRAFAEGIYVYPLPDNAAIHGMDMIVGQRRIQGEIHERKQAREIYQKAKKKGQRTSLVEQERPNVFTTSVANIAAGEQVSVELRYTQVLDRDGREFSLRLPLTMTPRYETPDPERYHSLDRVKNIDGQDNSGSFPTDIARTAFRTARLPDDAQQVSINARINAGLPLTHLVSRSHDIRTNHNDGDYNLTLAQDSVPMNRDFRLSWKLAPGADSAAAFFTETVGGEHYGLLLMMPPEPAAERKGVRKEQILVIDQSGSMRGERMKQARQSLLHALRRLDPRDRFNVVAFNNNTHTLFPEPVRASRDHVSQARDYVAGLDAGGGTEMLPAMKTALDMPTEPEFLRQIIFVTDGAIANEHAVLDAIHEKLDDARLFPVGIGAAPNGFLLRRLARFGRGTHSYIQDAGEVSATMKRLLDRIARPMLRDIRVELPEGIQGSFSPKKIPDLYQGEPVVATVKLDALPETVTVRGRNPQPWSREIRVHPDEPDHGVASLWARDRIGVLMDELTRGADKQTIRPQVVDIALQHELVSRFTSFVAVERKRTRREGESLETDKITPRLPSDMAKTGRNFPDTALHTGAQLRLGLILVLAGLLVMIGLRRRCHDPA